MDGPSEMLSPSMKSRLSVDGPCKNACPSTKSSLSMDETIKSCSLSMKTPIFVDGAVQKGCQSTKLHVFVDGVRPGRARCAVGEYPYGPAEQSTRYGPLVVMSVSRIRAIWSFYFLAICNLGGSLYECAKLRFDLRPKRKCPKCAKEFFNRFRNYVKTRYLAC